ncbi:MAG: hypothetical protein R6V02_01635, partial [Candidatus Aminicenantes bacterium]
MNQNPNQNDARTKAIHAAVSQIQKQFGKGAVMKMGQRDAAVKVPAIPTGSIAFDLALGIGGFPRGRVVEVFGPEATGKTTLGIHVIAEAQKQGGEAAFRPRFTRMVERSRSVRAAPFGPSACSAARSNAVRAPAR